MKKPLIGLTCNYLHEVPCTIHACIGAERQQWQLIAEDYISVIRKAGGIPIILPNDSDMERTKEVAHHCDGILISGGNDVDPTLFGERISRYCGNLMPIRDTFDITLVRHIINDTQKPILGICRGIQIMNVAMGGTVYQDIPSEGFPIHNIHVTERNIPTHSIEIYEDTRLASLLGEQKVMVNSYHHQAIHELAPDFVVNATSEDGIIECISIPGERFTLATQWHPEMMYDSELMARIFKAFIDACRIEAPTTVL